MSLQSVPFSKISEAEVQRLLDYGVGESVRLDYKRQNYGTSESDRKEFLKDVSSMANTLGGDLIIGVSETDGLPQSISPLVGDSDKEVQRLEQIAITGLEPRIRNLEIRPIPLAAGGYLILVRVPRSYLAPHRVILVNSARFYARAGTTTYEPNVDQLRQMFTATPLIADKIKAFHTDRLIRITANETPVAMNAAGKFVIHVVPIPAFTGSSMMDLIARLSVGTHVPVPPDEVGQLTRQSVNLDGYLNYTRNSSSRDARTAYAQFFRNGVIEGVADLRTDDGTSSRLVGAPFVRLVVDNVKQYLATADHYDMGLPAYVFLSLCNASNTVYRYPIPGGGFQESDPFGREIIALPEIYIDSFDVDVATAMRPAFNVLWNAFGHYHCDVYDADGKIREAVND
ncbi:helix-turn-helix domain-containing protein [Rhizobium ruizarguesonis]|uniref:AlbA family DNA-binding domain-containing protein n=1 Tax=Rhizobium ruizarguesonis TaxID=2081791 RepID=UPI001030F3EE|nr:ATP-binding protein [Rhizobium ruizarguesonis]TAW77435.1 ATP-binding protein [Rhizobium ruizarguesonis]TAX14401.1 ATP-binding protein [Rhizobium ruizarguesonis]TAX19232.1 ATP-binding protein [Rhizobium ruizarguesonis]